MFPSGYFPGAYSAETTTIVPSDPVTDALAAVKILIASVTYFQEWVGVSDAPGALASVHLGEVGFSILSISITSNVATLNTRDEHTFIIGDTITLQGASIGRNAGVSIDGSYEVVSVTGSAVTFATSLADSEEFFPDQALVFLGSRPLAVISESEEILRAESIATGGANIFGGSIDILFEADVSADNVNSAIGAMSEAREAYGKLVHGISLTQGTLDYIVLNDITPIAGPEFTHKTEQSRGDIRFERWRALIRVTWGLLS